MASALSKRIRRGGAYVIKAAETRPPRVTPRSGRQSAPTARDRKIASAVRKSRRTAG